MANRILRDYTDSFAVNSLSIAAECFFVRLITKADDFGSFHADHRLLKSALFPLRSDEISDKDILGWINECEKAFLLFKYSVNGKEYLRIVNFGQRLRNMRNKFPDPSESDLQLFAANRSNPLPETKRNETETKQKRNRNEGYKAQQLADESKVIVLPNGKTHQAAIRIFSDWTKTRTGMTAKINGAADGKAMKDILDHLRKQEKIKTEDDVLAAWTAILSGFNKCEPFIQRQTKLTQICSNLVQIVDQIRNGQPNKNDKPTVEDVQNDYLRRQGL